MKRYLVLLLLVASCAVQGQSKKISQLNLYSGAADEALVPAIVGSVNYKVRGADLSKTRIDSLITALAAKQGLVTSSTDLQTRSVAIGEYTSTSPSTPSAGLVSFARKRAGITFHSRLQSGGIETFVQPHFLSKTVAWAQPNGNSTIYTAVGLALSPTGTATARSVATTNLFTQWRRIGYVTGAAAGDVAGVRNNQLQYYRGDGPGKGGFLYAVEFGFSSAATVANERALFGMWSLAAAMTNVDPATLTNIFAIGKDAGDATLRIFTNDASGTATEIDLGANFPANTNNTDRYEFWIYAPQNGSSIFYYLRRKNTTDFVEGEVSTNLPTSTTLLTPHAWITNGGTTLASAFDIGIQYMETDY
jgi:hypothetical protein